MRNRRRLITIYTVIACLGAALALLILFFINKQHLFKTYSNKKHNFSIQYPADWTVREDIPGAPVVFVSPKENRLDFLQENVSVIIQDLSGKPMSLREYSDRAIMQVKVVFKQQVESVEEEPATLAQLPAFRFAYRARGPEFTFRYVHVWTLDGNTAYQVTFMGLDSQFAIYEKKMEKMFNSFTIHSP